MLLGRFHLVRCFQHVIPFSFREMRMARMDHHSNPSLQNGTWRFSLLDLRFFMAVVACSIQPFGILSFRWMEFLLITTRNTIALSTTIHHRWHRKALEPSSSFLVLFGCEFLFPGKAGGSHRMKANSKALAKLPLFPVPSPQHILPSFCGKECPIKASSMHFQIIFPSTAAPSLDIFLFLEVRGKLRTFEPKDLCSFNQLQYLLIKTNQSLSIGI